jgi:hypothetical protein
MKEKYYFMQQAIAKTYVTLFERVTWPLLFYLLMQEDICQPQANLEKSVKIKVFCKRRSKSLLQLAKS